MENIAGNDDPETPTVQELIRLKSIETSRMKVLEEISYCLSVAKRLLDIELGRIPH